MRLFHDCLMTTLLCYDYFTAELRLHYDCLTTTTQLCRRLSYDYSSIAHECPTTTIRLQYDYTAASYDYCSAALRQFYDYSMMVEVRLKVDLDTTTIRLHYDSPVYSVTLKIFKCCCL